MPILFVFLVAFLVIQICKKYGLVPWRMNGDPLSVWKKKRRKGRSPLLLLGGSAILRQCHRPLQPMVEDNGAGKGEEEEDRHSPREEGFSNDEGWQGE
jgi:hypothetical protein